MQRKHPYLPFRVALGSLTLQHKHPYFLFRVALGSLALPRKQVQIHPVRYPLGACSCGKSTASPH